MTLLYIYTLNTSSFSR